LPHQRRPKTKIVTWIPKQPKKLRSRWKFCSDKEKPEEEETPFFTQGAEEKTSAKKA
jgi:hypothetical protein